MFAARLRALAAPILIFAALVSSPAEAAEGLEWKWDGERRYQIKGDIQLNEWMFLRARNNVDVRISEIIMGITTVCNPVDSVGKKAVELHCTIEDMELLGTPVGPDVGKLVPILDEMEEHYKKATVSIIFTHDGRIRNIGLKGLDKRNRRINEINEVMRLLVSRLYAALDLQLPKGGRDRDRAWKQVSTLSLAFPSMYGTMGGADIRNEVSEQKGDAVEIVSQGKGTMGPAEMVRATTAGPDRVKNLYDMKYNGLATFDTSKGTLLERQYLIDGAPTASSFASEGGPGITYVQGVRLVYIPEGEEAPKLGANAEIPPRRTQGGTTINQ